MTEQKEPVWIKKKLAVAIHHELLERHGGARGLRDEKLLESALARPQNLYAYTKPDLCDMAGAYASGIIRNHPFTDGNKRTGFVMAAVFLDSNGMELTATEEEVVAMTLAFAAGEVEEDGYTKWLKDKTRPLAPQTAPLPKPHQGGAKKKSSQRRSNARPRGKR